MENSTFSMTFHAYKDEGLVVVVVDVIKVYPSMLSNSNWRDATYQLITACDQFHPYVLVSLLRVQQPHCLTACLGLQLGLGLVLGLV
jgi:hypothetical protein